MKLKKPKHIIQLYYFCEDKVGRSIRMELMVAFLICFLSCLIIGNWYNGYSRNNAGESVIDYKVGIDSIENSSLNMKNRIDKANLSIKDDEAINGILSGSKNNNETVKILITDLEGRILYKSNNSDSNEINIFDTIKKAGEFREKYQKNIILQQDSTGESRILVLNKLLEYVDITSLKFSDSDAYMIISAIPVGQTTYIKNANSPFFTGILQIIVFILLFYIITSKKMSYLEVVSNGLFNIAKGNLDYKLKIEGKDELSKLSDNINFMAKELKNRIEKEKNAENTKNELITNVSHDLRTPLTSIKGYIGLLKDKKYKNENELLDYLNIAYNKSEKLEILINNLFEYTKLSNNSISLKKENIFLNELLEQLVEELYVICKENNVWIKSSIPEEKVIAYVDGDKMVRVFENLLMNAIRYCSKNSEIKLTLKKEEKNIIVSVENKCENFSEEDLKRIFDRFYRVDKARTESVSGSGLGLAIAKSIVELHGGKIWAEYKDETITFYVSISGEKLD